MPAGPSAARMLTRWVLRLEAWQEHHELASGRPVPSVLTRLSIRICPSPRRAQHSSPRHPLGSCFGFSGKRACGAICHRCWRRSHSLPCGSWQGMGRDLPKEMRGWRAMGNTTTAQSHRDGAARASVLLLRPPERLRGGFKSAKGRKRTSTFRIKLAPEFTSGGTELPLAARRRS